MSAGRGPLSVAPADLARFLVAFGLVPLLLVSGFVGLDFAPATALQDRPVNDPPWSFALTPSWSPQQLGFIALAGSLLGVTSSRPATGLAAVAIGILLGLAGDLWWFVGFVRPEDQSFVSLLPQAEWRSRLTGSALILVGAVCAGFMVAAVVRRLVRDGSGPQFRRPTASHLAAIGVAVIGGPALALGIAWAAASSPLVVPDGSQVQSVRFSAGAISVDPAVLRLGRTWFRCVYASDAELWGALLVAIPEGADIEALPPVQNYEATCGPGDGGVTWGTVVDLRLGRYAWQQIDNSAEILRVTATSRVVVVIP